MSRMNSALTQQRLKELLHYDQESGVFTRRIRSSNRIKVGDIAGSLNQGRRLILVDTKRYFAHHLAWLYVHGHWPENYGLDHIDGDPDNNAIRNLRDIPHAVNLQNKRMPHKNNKSGFLGVIRARSGRWIARVIKDQITHQVGTYDTPEQAHAAYLLAKRKLHEGCTI